MASQTDEKQPGSNRLRVGHFFPTFRNIGGVEAVLRHHHAFDHEHGIDSLFLAYFEKDEPPIERVHSLHIQDSTHGIRSTRELVRAAVGPQGLDVAVYHGMWGFNFLCPADKARRRILLAHGGAQEFEGMLRRSAKWLDGVACVSQPLLNRVRNNAPSLASDRLARLFTPISLPAMKPKQPLAGRPIVIGYAGRVVVDSKRSDRLGPLYRELKKAGFPFKLEVLGEGDDLPRLKGELKDAREVVFHGTKTGDAYTDILNSWDVWASVSDSEGTPLSLLESLGLGCVPVFPRINTGGDAYVQAVSDGFLYPRGDLAAAARLIGNIAASSPAEISIWQQNGRKAISEHANGGYLPDIERFLRRVSAMPRISTLGRAWFPPLVDRLNFHQLGALWRLNAAFRAFLGRSRA